MGEANVKTIADIARLAGVSKATVSRALSGSPLVAEGTRQRIEAIARENNYRVNALARQLSTRRSRTIAFMVYGCYEFYLMLEQFELEVMAGVTRGLMRSGYDLLVASEDLTDPSWVRSYVDSGRVDGVILMTSTRKKHHIETLKEIGAPFIVFGLPQASETHCWVGGDNVAGGRLAAEHLIGLGRKRIAFFGGPAEELEARLRFEGFAAALSKAGRALDKSLILHGNYSLPSGTQRMRRLLDRRPDVDAVFANSDVMAIGAIREIERRGLHVPKDIAVIGYDDIAIATYTKPALTTIRQNIGLIGELLAQNLVEYIRTGVVTNTTVPVELVVRESA